MLLQSVLLLTLCGNALTAAISSRDYELYEEVTCKDTEECVRVSKCWYAVDIIDNKRMHHSYDRCGWYGNEEVVCCPKEGMNPPATELRHIVIKKAQNACNNFSESRIITVGGQILGGVPANPGEFPHMAALGYSKDGSLINWGSCGGSLISYDYVLTSAHCLSAPFQIDNIRVELDVFAVRLGKLDIKGDSDNLTAQDLKVVNVSVSPQYNPITKHNDIALLRLEKPVTVTKYILPACLYQNLEDPIKLITVTGWGFTTPSGNQSHILLKTKLKAFDITSCSDSRRINPLARGVIPSQMCAVSYDDVARDTCPGDSGGPAQITGANGFYVVGVTSYGHCGGTPGVYARVASYVSWIEEIVW